jgi:hypothetical protein
LTISMFYFKDMKRDFSLAIAVFKRFFSSSNLHKFCAFAFSMFVVKTGISLLIDPINVDALFLYLPHALHYFQSGGAGISTEPPGAIILFSWPYALSDPSFEPFRLIPFVFMISMPLFIYVFSKKYLVGNQPLVAFGLSCFAPIVDFGISGPTNWAWHSDFIALFFFAIAIFFYLNNKREDNWLAGIALALSIITKPAYGLAAAIIILSIYVVQKQRKHTGLVLFASAILGLTVYSWIGGFSKLAFLASPQLALVGGIAFLFAVTFLFANNNEKITVSSNGRLWKILLCQTIPLLWTIRQVLTGGTPFALPLFPQQLPSVVWWINFSNSIIQGAKQTLNIEALGILLYHPLFDIYLVPFLILGSIVLVLKRKMLIFLLVQFYYIYVAIMGGLAGVRQLLPVIIFTYPIISIGLTETVHWARGKTSQTVLLTLLIIYASLSVVQQPIFYYYDNLVISKSNIIISNIFSLIRTTGPPFLDYFNPFQIGKIGTIFLASFVLALALFILLKISRRVHNE